MRVAGPVKKIYLVFMYINIRCQVAYFGYLL